MKNVFIILTLLAAITLFTACRPCGSAPRDQYHTYNGSTVMMMEKRGYSGYPADTTKAYPYDQLFIKIDGKTIIASGPEPIPFFPTAYACSPADPSYYGLEQISALQISSDSAYNSSHPAGSSLNDLFKVKTWDSADTLLLTRYCAAFPLMASRYMYLYPMSAPDKPSIKFNIKIGLSNGTQVQLSTPAVHIQ